MGPRNVLVCEKKNGALQFLPCSVILNPDVIEGSDVFQFIIRGDLVNHENLSDPAEIVKFLYKLTGLPAGSLKNIVWNSLYK